MKKQILFSVFGLIILTAFLLQPLPLNGEEITGMVFLDQNKNSRREQGEKGIPDVRVSNGRDVSLTNSEGVYFLPITGETVIFITKPSGYQVPLNKLNLPQFYYIHRPMGSPDQKYKGIPPTGPLPKRIDFPLWKSEESDVFDVIVFGDPQPVSSEEVSFIRDDVAAELVGTDAAFGIALGDIMSNNLSLYTQYNEVVSQIGIPFYNVPGNHDMNFDSPDDRYSLETFISHFGPPYYSFDYGKVHFMVLDDVEWRGATPERKGRYKGKIGETQLAWIKNDLENTAKDKLVVISKHIPVKSMRNASEARLIENADRLFEILKEREHILLLAGHTHTLEQHFPGKSDGWNGTTPLHQITCATVCGSWWSGPRDTRGIPCADQGDGTPNGYHIFHFNGNTFAQDFKPAFRESGFQMRIISPANTIEKIKIPETFALVNVFNGNEKSKIEFRLDDLPYSKMNREIMKDPFIENLYEKNKDALKSWVSARPCFHIWSAPLPNEIVPGIHTITIKASEVSGKTFFSSRIFRVE